jgi:hypothetical protein
MPHLLLGFAALVLASWWVLARGGEDEAARHQPPPQQQSTTASSCDCGGCDLSVCDLGEACSGCDLSCDCIAVPPGALGPSLESAGGIERPPSAGPVGRQAWASLGLLVPLVVMFVWRRRR